MLETTETLIDSLRTFLIAIQVSQITQIPKKMFRGFQNASYTRHPVRGSGFPLPRCLTLMVMWYHVVPPILRDAYCSHPVM